jgi:glycosyltransferase involved in cell wall biosynthesis
MKAQVAVLIPTLNEEASIGRVIDRVPVRTLSNGGYETAIYVIDGDSEDETRQKALEKGAVVLPVAEPGKGAAMQHAFSSVRADYFIMIDGDDTYPPERIADFVSLLRTYDVVIGSRLKGHIEDGAMTRTNRFGNRVLTALANALFKKEITDLCTGFWGYRGHVIDSMHLVARGFEIEADMFVECARLGFSIGELAIDYNKRADRPKLSSASDGFKIGFFLLKRRMTLGLEREP